MPEKERDRVFDKQDVTRPSCSECLYNVFFHFKRVALTNADVNC